MIQVIEKLPKPNIPVRFKKRWGYQVLKGIYEDGEFRCCDPSDINHYDTVYDCFLDVSEWEYVERGLNNENNS